MAKFAFYPVILAGGRGTRFWPLSRKHRAKQLLALDDARRTMLQQTVDRLAPLAERKNFWVITNNDLRDPIVKQSRPLLGRDHEQLGSDDRNDAPLLDEAQQVIPRIIIERGHRQQCSRAAAHMNLTPL